MLISVSIHYMDNIKVNYKQLARDIDVSYSVLLGWRTSRYALIDYLITSIKNDKRIASLESDIDKLKAKIRQINKFTSEYD